MKYEIKKKQPTISINNSLFKSINDKFVLNILNDYNDIIKRFNIYSYYNEENGLYYSIYIMLESNETELIKQFLLSNDICFLYKIHNEIPNTLTIELRLKNHILLEFL